MATVTSAGPGEPSVVAGTPSPLRRALTVVITIAALLAGTIATGAGLGIGIRFAQKTGFTFRTILGFLLLAVGVALLIWAGRRMWRGLHRWLRLLLIPVVLVVLVLALSIQLAVMFTVVPPTALGSATPAVYGLHYSNVTVPTRDGVRLSGWYIPSRNGSAIIVRHGAGSTRTSALAQAAVLARSGYGVLLVDARGHGRSGGDGMDLGWYGDRDVSAAVDFVERQPSVDPHRIGVLGLSMGGEEAIGAAASDPRIRAVVAEGATGRTAEDKARWLPHGVNGWLQRRIDQLTYDITGWLTDAARPISLHKAVRLATHTHFLLITAGSQHDEAKAAGDLRQAAPSRVTTWDVPQAQHTGGLARDRKSWESHVLAFLGGVLKPVR